jgi:hypothetical protein
MDDRYVIAASPAQQRHHVLHQSLRCGVSAAAD